MSSFLISSPVDHHLADKILARSNATFKARSDRPQLEATVLYREKDSDGHWWVRVKPVISINEPSQLQSIAEQNDACAHIYTIRHLRSWTTLNISRELFERLLTTHYVFHHFWKLIFTFGVKAVENEYAFPAFRARCSKSGLGKVDELSYVIRRVERHNRPLEQGASPWSIRQTAIYHKLTYPNDASQHTSVFICVAPSRAAEDGIKQCFQEPTSEGDIMKPSFCVHERVVADSLIGWMDYMAWLEEESKKKSTRGIASDIDNRKIYFHADDRQHLKQLEDYITDLLVILQTMLDTIQRIGASCKRHCQTSCTGICSCSYMIEEFGEFAAETQIYLQRAKVLKARVQSTEQLLSDLLGYEETRALKQLAQISHDESHNISKLTKRSVQDAAAVKMLAIIGLVYLPTTIVANFFSTEFVHVSDQGKMRISGEAWILAKVAAPLTVFTIVAWLLCMHYGSPLWEGIKSLLRRRQEEDLEMGSQGDRVGKETSASSSAPLFSLMTSFTRRESTPPKAD